MKSKTFAATSAAIMLWLSSAGAASAMYHPTLGRFLNRDPIAADINPYRYVENRPISDTDPTGYLATQPSPGHLPNVNKARLFAECQKHYNDTLRFDKRVRNCYEVIAKRVDVLKAKGNTELAKKCGALKFECICCSDKHPGAAAYYDPNAHTIFMCAENSKFRGADDYRGAVSLCHEMTHVLQGPSCHEAPWPSSCINILANEVQAYYCTGECTGARRCLDLAISSGHVGGGCKEGEPTREQYDSVLKWAVEAIRSGNLCNYGINPEMF